MPKRISKGKREVWKKLSRSYKPKRSFTEMKFTIQLTQPDPLYYDKIEKATNDIRAAIDAQVLNECRTEKSLGYSQHTV
jgi:hypothetical protein